MHIKLDAGQGMLHINGRSKDDYGDCSSVVEPSVVVRVVAGSNPVSRPIKNYSTNSAGVAKLVDALDLGSSVLRTWGFKSLHPHHSFSHL